MRPCLRDLADRSFDVVVIGGGAMCGRCARGCIARLQHSAGREGRLRRGRLGALLQDGARGVRDRQHLDIARLRNSCRERATMLRLAPHLVAPLPIAIPTYGWGRHGKPFLGAGMMLYDLLSADRNRDNPDPARCIAATRFLSPEEVLEQFPSIEHRALTGAAVFEDWADVQHDAPGLGLCQSPHGRLEQALLTTSPSRNSCDAAIGSRVSPFASSCRATGSTYGPGWSSVRWPLGGGAARVGWHRCRALPRDVLPRCVLRGRAPVPRFALRLRSRARATIQIRSSDGVPGTCSSRPGATRR